MFKYLNFLGDVSDLIEDSVDVLQQLRYGNEDAARVKLIKIASSANRMVTEMNNNFLAANIEGEGE